MAFAPAAAGQKLRTMGGEAFEAIERALDGLNRAREEVAGRMKLNVLEHVSMPYCRGTPDLITKTPPNKVPSRDAV